MNVRKSGKADLVLPTMGVGCFSFGGGAYWGVQDQKDVSEVVARALELGLNLFDTAESYNDGASEEALGRALSGRRERALITSKIRPDFAYRGTIRARCEASLRRLNTDYIDVYMLHWPLNANAMLHFTQNPAELRSPPTITEALETLNELRVEGKIRHIGVSNFGVTQIKEAVEVGVPIALNELPYGLLMRGVETEILPYCVEQGIGVLGYMALSQGLLSDKFASLDDLPPARTRTRHFRGDRPGARHGEPGIEMETMGAIQALRAEARAAGIPLSVLALAWAMANPAITSVLVGARNRNQLESNHRAVQLGLSRELLQRLDAITQPIAQRLGSSADYFQSSQNSRSY